MIEIGGHEFRGPLRDVGDVSEWELGVYCVICLVDDNPHCMLDIGTAEGGVRADVTPTGNLQYRLKTHGRKDCWKENVHGESAYYVKYIMDTEERLGLESELKWKFEYPCGTNPWREIEDAWDQYKAFEEEHGNRGSHEI